MSEVLGGARTFLRLSPPPPALLPPTPAPHGRPEASPTPPRTRGETGPGAATAEDASRPQRPGPGGVQLPLPEAGAGAQRRGRNARAGTHSEAGSAGSTGKTARSRTARSQPRERAASSCSPRGPATPRPRPGHANAGRAERTGPRDQRGAGGVRAQPERTRPSRGARSPCPPGAEAPASGPQGTGSGSCQGYPRSCGRAGNSTATRVQSGPPTTDPPRPPRTRPVHQGLAHHRSAPPTTGLARLPWLAPPTTGPPPAWAPPRQGQEFPNPEPRPLLLPVSRQPDLGLVPAWLLELSPAPAPPLPHPK